MKERFKRAMDLAISGLAPLLTHSRRRGVILCYHRIGGSGSAVPADDATTIPFERLEAQLRWLAGFCRFRTLDEIVHGAGGDGRWEVAVTFDDGYRDNLELGRPLFERYQVPVTWFISTDFVANAELIPWWDLAAILAEEPASHAPIRLEELGGEAFALAGAGDRGALCRALKRLHERGPWDRARAVTEELARKLRAAGAVSTNAMARPADLRAASASGVFRLAPHTCSHPNLALLPRERQRAEIEGSRDALERWVGPPAPWFAYPFGNRAMRDESSEAVTRDLGFRGGLTTEPGYVDSAYDPFALPRLVVDGRWPLERFCARVLAADLCRRELG